MAERRRMQRAAKVRRARFPYAPPPSAPFKPLLCRGLEAGVPSCGVRSQGLKRGEKPELRGHAAVQVVAAKVPAREAPEREIMG